MALTINRKPRIESQDIYDAIELLHQKLSIGDKHSQFTASIQIYAPSAKINKGTVILKALNLTVTDINAGASDLYRTLIELKMINEIELVRSILTEYLIHFSNS